MANATARSTTPPTSDYWQKRAKEAETTLDRAINREGALLAAMRGIVRAPAKDAEDIAQKALAANRAAPR